MQSRPLTLLAAALALAGTCLAPTGAAATRPKSPPPVRALTALEKTLPQHLQDILSRHTPGRTLAAQKAIARVNATRSKAADAEADQTATAAAAPPPANGSNPQGLVQGSDGALYGATMTGGANNNGVLYKLTLGTVRGKTTYAYSVLYTFSAADAYTRNADGVYPVGALVEDRSSPGTFYGATLYGGTQGGGTVFRFTTRDATLTTLHSFAAGSPIPTDGAYPVGSLIQAQDGNFYGTTFHGGYSANDGTMYRITSSGDYKQLHVFTYGEGVIPSPLLEDTSNPGTFYGTTRLSLVPGTQNNGSVFKATAAGRVTFLHFFSFVNGHANAQGYTGTNTEGAYPAAGLLLASDGNFYGTATAGGAYGGGTVFKMDRAGNVTAAYSFHGQADDGAYPSCALVEDRNNPGDLYGTTPYGGSGHGGVFAVLLPFPNRTGTGSLNPINGPGISDFDGANGDGPYSGVIQAQDGDFYGVTSYGGASLKDTSTGNGVIFGMHSSGSAGIVYNLSTGTNLRGTARAGSSDSGGAASATPTNLGSAQPLGWVEQPRPNSSAAQYGHYSSLVGDYDWTGLTGVLNLDQYGTANYTIYLGPSSGHPVSTEEIDPDGYSTGGTWDLSGTSTFKWLWTPWGGDPSGIKNDPRKAANDPSQPFPAPPLYAVAIEAPYTESKFYDGATGPQPTSAHGKMSDGFATSNDRSFSGVPGAAPANSVRADNIYINDLPRHFVVPAAVEGDNQTADGTVSPSLHIDITDHAFDPVSYIYAEMQAVVSRIEMVAPSIFQRPDLGSGTNQFSYGDSAQGELDIPGEITPFGAYEDDVDWLAGLPTLGPRPPSGTQNVGFRFDAADTPPSQSLGPPQHNMPQVTYDTTPNIDGYSIYPDTVGADGLPDFVFKSATLGLSSLPADYRAFGNHTVTMTVDTYDPIAGRPTTHDSEVAHIQTFFNATATNHPNPTGDPRVASLPNWLYYYNQIYPFQGANGQYSSRREWTIQRKLRP